MTPAKTPPTGQGREPPICGASKSPSEEINRDMPVPVPRPVTDSSVWKREKTGAANRTRTCDPVIEDNGASVRTIRRDYTRAMLTTSFTLLEQSAAARVHARARGGLAIAGS